MNRLYRKRRARRYWTRRGRFRKMNFNFFYFVHGTLRQAATYFGLSIRDLHRLRRRLGLSFKITRFGDRMIVSRAGLMDTNRHTIRRIALRASRIGPHMVDQFRRQLWLDPADHDAATWGLTIEQFKQQVEMVGPSAPGNAAPPVSPT